MRALFIRILAVAALCCCGVRAQNSDLGLLAGVSVTSSGTVGSNRVSGTVTASGQINYAIQVYETQAGQLYVELPVLFTSTSAGVVVPALVTSTGYNTIFFTPGARWRFTFASRVSLYAALGAGIGTFGSSTSVVAPGMVGSTSTRTTTGALGFGGGLDLRLSRLVSLRVEGRDFVTRSGLGGSPGSQHSFFMVGAAFHF